MTAIVIGTVIAIAVVTLRSSEPRRSFAPIESYSVLDDDRTLVLAIGLGHLDSIGYIATDEDSTSVHARVLLLNHQGTSTADMLRIDVRTRLAAPLGSRAVVDQDGRTIRRGGR